ncbi:MAG TPA: ACP phosphodiesterase [Gallionellaceae bacterium]
MNFLAHALLAGDQPALIVGGVAGDWVKGHLPGGLPPDLARGVALHRAIDDYAETHPAFKRSRARVSASRRRYSGVLVDVFYDHLLAQNWSTLHQQPLPEYCAGVYAQIRGRLDDLPASAHHALALMASEDWLGSYARIEGIADVFRRMSRRARQPNPLAAGEQEFLADAAGYTADFHDWLTGAQAFCRQWLAQDAA